MEEIENEDQPKSGISNRKKFFSNVWFQFSLSLILIVLLFISILYSDIFLSQEKSINKEFKSKASSIFNGIVMTRKWNAMYGGVFVEKKEGIQSNPYLKNPDIETIDGKIFTKKNPALMTREISEIAEKEGVFKFRITSLILLNPNNAPDEFEKESLLSFENGTAEAFIKEDINGIPFYRYMAPLLVDETCLKCHDNNGYKVGDVRGGISVKFSILEAEQELKRSRIVTIALFIATMALIILLITRLVFNLYKRLSEAEQKLKELLNTDALTGLSNRRFLMGWLFEEIERARRYKRDLCCIMMDIDFFKKLNDTFGHQAGDEVLRTMGEILKSISRSSDIAGRYGGEEFIVLLPETDIEGALAAAEKMRSEVENTEIVITGDKTVKITASFGVSRLCTEDDMPLEEKATDLVERADKALYKAKAEGRNRVCRNETEDC